MKNSNITSSRVKCPSRLPTQHNFIALLCCHWYNFQFLYEYNRRYINMYCREHDFSNDRLSCNSVSDNRSALRHYKQIWFLLSGIKTELIVVRKQYILCTTKILQPAIIGRTRGHGVTIERDHEFDFLCRGMFYWTVLDMRAC